jgi:hypothetical protein
MSSSGTLQSNDGAYTIANVMSGKTVFLPQSGKQLTVADAQLATVTLFCGGENETSVTDQYYEHTFAQAATPGNSETWYAPKPTEKFLKPPPDDPSWTLAYEISAPGNTLDDLKGNTQIARHQNTDIQFGYQIDETNGAAWYALSIWYLDTGQYPVGVQPAPSVVVQLGNTPAVHVS